MATYGGDNIKYVLIAIYIYIYICILCIYREGEWGSPARAAPPASSQGDIGGHAAPLYKTVLLIRMGISAKVLYDLLLDETDILFYSIVLYDLLIYIIIMGISTATPPHFWYNLHPAIRIL